MYGRKEQVMDNAVSFCQRQPKYLFPAVFTYDVRLFVTSGPGAKAPGCNAAI
jgi:hypothetical protein